MNRINQYLDEVATTTETKTDYAIAQALGITKQQVWKYRKGAVPKNEVCRKIAEHLGVDPFEIIAAATADEEEKSKSESAEKWEQLWRRVRRSGHAAALAIIAFSLSALAPQEAKAFTSQALETSIHYTQLLRRWLRRLMRPTLPMQPQH